MAYIPHHWERTHLMNYKWMNELQITVKNIGKHKSFPNAEFLKIFGVKRNADNPLNMGKVNFRFTWKLWEYKNISKLRNSWIFGMKQKSAQTLRKCEWFSHHGKKCGNTKKHTQILGFLKYSGRNKNICNLQIMENIYPLVMGKLKLFSNDGFFTVFQVKQKYMQTPKYGNREFPF